MATRNTADKTVTDDGVGTLTQAEHVDDLLHAVLVEVAAGHAVCKADRLGDSEQRQVVLDLLAVAGELANVDAFCLRLGRSVAVEAQFARLIGHRLGDKTKVGRLTMPGRRNNQSLQLWGESDIISIRRI